MQKTALVSARTSKGCTPDNGKGNGALLGEEMNGRRQGEFGPRGVNGEIPAMIQQGTPTGAPHPRRGLHMPTATTKTGRWAKDHKRKLKRTKERKTLCPGVGSMLGRKGAIFSHHKGVR